MNLVNLKLSPEDRAFLLRSVGFNVNKNSGQVNGIKNICYKDTNPNLSINLNTGLVKDFGNSDYNGDIITLISKAIGKDFKETVKFMGHKLKKDLFSAGADGMSTAEELYQMPEEEVNLDFWNKDNWNRMLKCQEVIHKRGIPKGMEYIINYDGITLETLIKNKCGIYGYGDFSFGLTNTKYNSDLWFIMPFKTGALLYRRDENGKQLRNIKGSKPSESFFNINKDDDKYSIIYLMKSPREAMNLSQYCLKAIGLISGENVRNITDHQLEQLNSIMDEKDCIINCVFDCDTPSAYDNAIIACKTVEEALDGKAVVSLVNIHKASNGKFKDFTDIVQYSIKKTKWNPKDSEFPKLEDKAFSMFAQSITKAEIIK